MQSFLSQVASKIISDYSNISQITFILPSKRAGLFLKAEIKNQLKKASILPKIVNIESFIKTLSGLEQIDSITLIFEFYKIYKKNTPKQNLDSFDTFSKWATILLHDFNEIDSNLMDAEIILNNINNIERIENWNLKPNQNTPLLDRYLDRFNQIKIYYADLQKHLLDNKLGYQGLLYKKAHENTLPFLEKDKKNIYIFAGFNALNIAEESIIHEFLIQKRADIFWDNDTFYSNNNLAGKYFKKYKTEWNYYKKPSFNWNHENINTKKNIYLHGAPKNVTQIKKVADLLNELNKNKKIENTAVILANEKLLPTLLNSIPKKINHINITMGYDLQNIPTTSFFNSIFKLHINKLENENKFYYKDFLRILQNPLLHSYWASDVVFNKQLNTLLFKNKTTFISSKEILELTKHNAELASITDIIFNNYGNNTQKTLHNFNNLIDLLKNNSFLNTLDKEYLFRFYNIFQQLNHLNQEYDYIDNIKTLYLFYKQILKTEKLSFQGEPLKGLQIMGVLESRVLDFENVIITSVNEGFLPAAGSQNSFIPMDIKQEMGLPTYKEKDAIFAYHFFRLFHRAKNIHILYNTETDDFGSGEQSRFITQLEIAKQSNLLNNVTIIKNLVIPKLQDFSVPLQEIDKTKNITLRLKELALLGLSPSSLGSYIRNPIDFYKQKVLLLKEFKELEETVAANTLGTIIHTTLEALYTPFKGKYITKEDILAIKKSLLHTEVTKQFKNHYSLQSISSGKNYLIFEIAKQFLINFLNFEISELEKGKKIKILNLEQNIECEHSINGLPFTVKLKGQIDRIDEVDGVLRIVDYKTGKVNKPDLNISDWELLVTDEKFSKSFQVLLYAFMYGKVHAINFDETPIQSGIISFKNLKEGFMKVTKASLTEAVLEEFLIQLDLLILEIYNPTIPFKEKEIIPFKF